MAAIYARLRNQYKFKYQTVFSARFDKQHNDGQTLNKIELYKNLNDIHNLTERGNNNIGNKSTLENQFQNQHSRWRLDKLISMTIHFHRVADLLDLGYVKFPLRSSATLKIQNGVKNGFIWSILVHLHPVANSKTGHPTRI